VSTGAGIRAETILRRLEEFESPLFAEVGVLYGAVTACVLAWNPVARAIMVDNWVGAEDRPERYTATGDFNALRPAEDMAEIEDAARARVRKFGDRVTIIKADSVDAAGEVEDGSLALVFIDADHSYEGVKRDIAAWLPKVMRGGWIGGHDYRNHSGAGNFLGVDRAVEEFSRNFGREIKVDSNFTWWSRVA